MDYSIKLKSKRLFLPLTSEAFEWYSQGKNIEIRKEQNRFKNIFNFNYTLAELRKGYGGPSIWANIITIKKYESIDDLLLETDYRRIIPISTSEQDARIRMSNYVDNKKSIIAIHMNLVPII